MHDSCVAIKTISLEIDAYEKLRRAKREPRESFSNVVRRAKWDDLPPKAAELLEELGRLSRERPDVLLPLEALNALGRRRRTKRVTSRWRL